MDKLGPYERTGRITEGPASDLVEVLRSDGGLATAIVFHEIHRETDDLFAFIQRHRAFLAKPGVDGIAPLIDVLPAEGALVYHTGSAWSVAELVRLAADAGEPCGVRAGLELAYRTSRLLVELLDRGDAHGVFGHGALTPWRLMVRPDGRVLVLGLGAMQPEVQAFVEDETEAPPEDSLRYVPPERLAGEAEDVTSDLYSLALVAAEVMTGRPLYDGLFQDIRQQAERGEGTYRLYKWRDKLPDVVHTLFARALKHDMDSRFHEPLDFVYGVHDIIESVDAGDGPGLAEVVGRLRREGSRNEAIQGGSTSMLSKADIARMADEMEDHDAAPLELPSRPRPVEEVQEVEQEQGRWGSVRRPESRAPAPAPTPPPAAPAAPADPQRERLRSRLGRGRTSEPPHEPTPAPAAPGAPAADRRDALRSRLRSGSRGGGEPAAPEPVAPEPASSEPSKRDLLRSRLKHDTTRPSVAAPPEPTPPPVAPPEPPRRAAPAPAPAVVAETVDDAASLLARLRGAKPPAPALRPPTPTIAPAEETSMDDIGADFMEPELPAKPVRPAPEPVVEPELPPDDPTDEDEVSLEDASLLEEPLRSDLFGKAERAVRVRGRRVVLHCAPSLTVGELIARSLAAAGTLPVDLSGRATGWYVASQGGAALGATRLVTELPAEDIELEPIVASERLCQVHVVGAGQEHRFRAPVAQGLPSRFLVEYLVSWLGLAQGPWRMWVGDDCVGEWDVLERYTQGAEPVLEVRQ